MYLASGSQIFYKQALNNTQKAVFLIWPFADYIMLMWKKIPGSFCLAMFPFWSGRAWKYC